MASDPRGVVVVGVLGSLDHFMVSGKRCYLTRLSWGLSKLENFRVSARLWSTIRAQHIRCLPHIELLACCERFI